MWIKQILSDANGQPSSARTINIAVFCVSTYVIIKAANAIPPADPSGMAALLGAYIAAFTIPAAAGKFAERKEDVPNTDQSGK